MARITLYTKNILEDAAVSVSGDGDTGFPESRLYDRDISLYWKRAATGIVEIDAIGSSVQVDFLAIEKHNFAGKTLNWQYSNDGFSGDTNNMVDPWVPGTGQIIKTVTSPINSPGFRAAVSSITAPQCSEVFMSLGLELRVRFDEKPTAVDVPNVSWQRTVGGIERSTKKGASRRERDYAIFLDENDSEITNFRAAMDNLDEHSKPFYIKDHEGDYWMCRFVEPPREIFATEGHVLISLRVIEKL